MLNTLYPLIMGQVKLFTKFEDKFQTFQVSFKNSTYYFTHSLPHLVKLGKSIHRQVFRL